jgi:hypothetical protein
LQVAAGMSFTELSGFLILLTILQIVMIAVYIATRFMAHFEEVR